MGAMGRKEEPQKSAKGKTIMNTIRSVKRKKWNKIVNHFKWDNNKPLCIKDTHDNRTKTIKHKAENHPEGEKCRDHNMHMKDNQIW